MFFRAWAIREMVLGPEHPAVADSLHRLALSMYPDDLSMAMPLLHRAMELRIRAFGHDDASVADSLSAMANMYEVHQRRDLAIPLYQEALSIREKVFGPNTSQTFGHTQQLKHGSSLDGPP
ncbi:MAG: tetratricopeptide repeat protein [Nitrospira sp.]